MLVIRNEQIQILAEPMLRAFEDKMVPEMHEAFPEECASMKETDLRATIRHGMTRAMHFDLDTEGQMKRWLTLMFTFGYNFHADPDYLWAARVLGGPTHGEAKMERLFEAALAHEADGKGFEGIPKDPEAGGV